MPASKGEDLITEGEWRNLRKQEKIKEINIPKAVATHKVHLCKLINLSTQTTFTMHTQGLQ
jgi:hypothetical protein